MLKYRIVIQYSDEDECYVASVPDLRGCMAHGATPEQAMKEILVAQELWIETAIEDGQQLPEPLLYVS